MAREVTAGYSFAINTKKYGKTIRMQLRAYDRAGNLTSTAIRTWKRQEQTTDSPICRKSRS